jgi:4-amino-4-deoxy-L-arabinose transferase-like glycosyltransferase
MLHSGDWAVPVLNGNPFLEKPPLMHWTSLLLITITGIVNEGMMRLPSAIYGFGAVLVTYLWGRREHNERTGLCAAFLCTGSLLYFEYAKTTFTDATLVFFVILSMYLFWRAFSTDRFRYRNYLPFIFVSALAFFAKGLIGVAFVWVPIEAYLAYRREWRLFFLLPVFYLPVFSVLVGYWAWKLWSVGGLEYLRIVFVDNQIGRFFTFTDTSLPRDPYFFHKEPIYYYLLDSPLRMLPWVFLLPGALYYYFRPGKRAGSEFELYLKFALVCMLLILHASSAKVSTYMLPVYPVLFYLAAVWMDRELGNWRWTGGQWMIVLGGLCAGILALIPTGLVIGLYLAPQSFFDRYLQGYDAMQAVSDNLALACFLASLVVAGLTVYAMAKALARLRAGHGVELTAAFPGTITLLFAIGAALLVQIYDPQRSFKPVADEALTEMNNGYRIALGTHDELATGGFSFYLDRILPVYTDPQAAMDFLDGKKAILILQKKDRGRLHALIDSGKYSVTEMAGQGHVSRSFIFVRNDPA